ncbi:hypothetical protein KY495_06980 [Massilia sp. PAMC28688]|uniref:hypothetical protein n=1 Tax=Massilia sp. PAMC28688 TaxID=2861283 RepID=UPI001C627A40|nr:hypothetical protein [Massilia sp. PAMC28688]QYF94914.1 hypothetical protein KY495_06980 [Massilia sp. PAMC28688]
MLKHTAILCTALLAACSERTVVQSPAEPMTAEQAVDAAPAPDSVQGPLTLGAESIGPVKFGSKLSEVEKALKEKAGGAQTEECSYVKFASLPEVLFMVEKGIVTRADLRGDVPNTTGFKVGDDPAALRSKYPGAVVTGHNYVPAGHNIKVQGQGRAALLFEDDGERITSVRAGIEPAVSYSEGCS